MKFALLLTFLAIGSASAINLRLRTMGNACSAKELFVPGNECANCMALSDAPVEKGKAVFTQGGALDGTLGEKFSRTVKNKVIEAVLGDNTADSLCKICKSEDCCNAKYDCSEDGANQASSDAKGAADKKAAAEKASEEKTVARKAERKKTIKSMTKNTCSEMGCTDGKVDGKYDCCDVCQNGAKDDNYRNFNNGHMRRTSRMESTCGSDMGGNKCGRIYLLFEASEDVAIMADEVGQDTAVFDLCEKAGCCTAP